MSGRYVTVDGREIMVPEGSRLDVKVVPIEATASEVSGPVPHCCGKPMERMYRDFWYNGVIQFPLRLVFPDDMAAFEAKGQMMVIREPERHRIGHSVLFYACRNCGHVDLKLETGFGMKEEFQSKEARK